MTLMRGKSAPGVAVEFEFEQALERVAALDKRLGMPRATTRSRDARLVVVLLLLLLLLCSLYAASRRRMRRAAAFMRC